MNGSAFNNDEDTYASLRASIRYL